MPHLLGMLPSDLAAHLQQHGIVAREDEVRRLLAHTFTSKPEKGHRQRHPVARRLQEAVAAVTENDRLEVVERVTDPADQFVKYLLRSPDGALSEAVRIPLHKPGCYSVCLSSQVGCAMQCRFCATGRLGLARNLAAWEMVSAFLTVRDEAPGRVTGAVFQGQGEPLHNYDEVIQAARVLTHSCGAQISAKAITISTVGLVPQIRRYTAERHPYRLIISLTSALAERRAQLLPVAGRFTLEEVADAIREYARACGERVTIAWVLLGGVNSGPEEAEALVRLFADVPLRINLIDVNDARPPEAGGYVRASDEERGAFMGHLQALRAPIVRRYSGGAGRHAACGMLASLRLGDAAQAPDPMPGAHPPR
ncbi:MAG TPA: radical SAM protein [Polyangia bacterium]|nr:radical SAM protein [Polyangia bacterium]